MEKSGQKTKSVPPGGRLEMDEKDAADLVDASAARYEEADEAFAVQDELHGVALHQAIGQAMRAIDPDEGLTREGKVSLYALQAALGFRPSAEDRDIAHEIYGQKRPDLFDPADGDIDTDDDLADVKAAILDLDKENPSMWTANGLPDVRALGAKLNRKVTAEERDAAVEALSSDEQ